MNTVTAKATSVTLPMPKKSKLKAVDPITAEPQKPKILIYGASGVGKTFTSMDFPKCYYLDTEGGASRKHYTDKLKASGGVYFGIDQGSQIFDNVIEEVKTLATESHEFRTLVLDSGSKIYDLARQAAAEKGGDDYGRDKKEANKPARRLMSWLQRIDMTVIIICHEVPLWGIDNKGERSQIGVTFDAWPKLNYELDLALNIQKTGPRRFARVTKSRLLEFPEESNFDWSYEEFAKRYGKEIIERQTKTIELISVEQLAEIKRLLDLVKLPEDWLDKTLTKAAVEELSELNSDQATKTITFLKARLS